MRNQGRRTAQNFRTCSIELFTAWSRWTTTGCCRLRSCATRSRRLRSTSTRSGQRFFNVTDTRGRSGLAVRRTGRTSPSFFSDQLDVEVDIACVRHIRGLWHTLTHLRGELRSPQQREQFGRNSDDGYASYRAELSVDVVLGALDDLAEVVRRADRVAWRFAYGGRRLELS